jgi:hypothetical protein
MHAPDLRHILGLFFAVFATVAATKMAVSWRNQHRSTDRDGSMLQTRLAFRGGSGKAIY